MEDLSWGTQRRYTGTNLDMSQPRPTSAASITLATEQQASAMAKKAVFVVLFVCFLGPASATYCSDTSDCDGLLESCCSDSVCREACSSCSYDFQCGTGECCDSDGDCYDCMYITSAGIAGIVVGSLVFVAIVVSIFACCCCACCPYYRHRHPGTVIVAQPGYQPFVNTTTTTTQQTVQHPPPSGYNPPGPGYYPPPTGAYAGQPPPYYPQPQAAPQAAGTGQPAKPVWANDLDEAPSFVLTL